MARRGAKRQGGAHFLAQGRIGLSTAYKATRPGDTASSPHLVSLAHVSSSNAWLTHTQI